MALFRPQIPPPDTATQPARLVAGVSLQELWSTPSGTAALGELKEATAGTDVHADLTAAPVGVDDDGDTADDGGKGEHGAGRGSGRKKVAASDGKDNSSPSGKATVLALALFGIGLIGAVWAFHTSWGPTYKPVKGVGIFALFYIVAQAVERAVEIIAMPLFEKNDSFNKGRKQVELDKALETYYAAANSPNGSTPVAKNGEGAEPEEKTADQAANEAANKQAEIDQLRANRTVIMFGLAAGLGMTLCGYLEADFLTTVGAHFGAHPSVWQQALMMAVTGLIVGGGSKQLHDLISNVSKGKDQKDTPTETGGQK